MFSLKHFIISVCESKNIQTSTVLFQDPPAVTASVVGRFATPKTKARTTKSAKLFFMSSCMRCLTEIQSEFEGTHTICRSLSPFAEFCFGNRFYATRKQKKCKERRSHEVITTNELASNKNLTHWWR